MTHLDEQVREEFRQLAQQAVREGLQQHELEAFEQRKADVEWRTKLDATLAHLLSHVEEIHGSLNHEQTGTRPRVRMLEEQVRGLEGNVRSYSRAVWLVGSATTAALVKLAVDALAGGRH